MKNRIKPYQIRIHFLGFLSAGLLLSSCGFQPLYGNISSEVGKPNMEQLLRRVEIDLINDREGQVLRNELIDRLHNTGATQPALYRLKVSTINETKRNLDITKESDSTIANLRLSTNIILTKKGSKESLISKTIWSTTSYNILESQFTTRVSRNYARENGLKNIAEQIERQVSLALRAQQ